MHDSNFKAQENSNIKAYFQILQPAWLHKMVTESLTKLIVCDNLPLTVLDLPWLKDLLQALRPEYIAPSATTFRDSLLAKPAATARRSQLDRLRPFAGQLTLTMDGLSGRMGSLVSVTASASYPEGFSVTLESHHDNNARHNADFYVELAKKAMALLHVKTDKG